MRRDGHVDGGQLMAPLPVTMWMEEVRNSPSNNERSAHFDSKAVRHTTTKRRKGPKRGGVGKIGRLPR